MNNKNRPKANYHLLATVATLGLVRGGGYVRIKVFELGAKRRKGSGESGPQCPHRGLSRSDWGVDGMVSFVWLNNEMALF